MLNNDDGDDNDGNMQLSYRYDGFLPNKIINLEFNNGCRATIQYNGQCVHENWKLKNYINIQ